MNAYPKRNREGGRRYDAGEVARMLNGRVETLVREILPAGRREGGEWRVGSVAGEPGGSLSVRLYGQKAGLWRDFSGGDKGGDALDLVAAVLFGGDKAEAILWGASWLGLAGDDRAKVPLPAAAAPPVAKTRDGVDRGDAARTAFAWRIYCEAQPSVLGTPVAAYLAGRGIDLYEFKRAPRALRFHPRLDNREAGRALPAMVAAVNGRDGKFQAVHRTWLEREGGVWRKARLQKPKMVLGLLRGGTIRLWRGADNTPLGAARANSSVVVAEGIETGLSVALACPEKRVLAAVSVGNMAEIDLPAAISSVVIAADNDAPDSQATRALEKAIAKLASEGRKVFVARARAGGDFNDVLSGAAVT